MLRCQYNKCSPHFCQEPVKKKGRTVTTGKVKEETSNFLIKPKPKKQGTIKKENQAEKSRFVYFTEGDRSNLLMFVPFFFSFFLISLFDKSFHCSQFSGAAICHPAREQTTQELHIQSSAPSHQHPKDQTPTETEM